MKTSWNLFVGLIVTSAAVFGGCASFQTRPDFYPAARTGAAVQAAIDAATAAGGGRVVLEKGVYPSGTIYLKSHVELHLEEGAVLLGGAHLEDYDDVDDPRVTKAPEKSEAELQRHGSAREISAVWDPRRKGYVFDLKAFYDLSWAAPGAEPDYSAYLVFTIDVPKGGKAVLYEQNDWYGQFYVNGKPVGDLVGNIFDWSRVEVPLKSGMNEILFRTSPGSGGFWWATLGVERP